MHKKSTRNDSEIRDFIYSSNLIDRTFYDEKHNEDVLKNLKFARRFYLRLQGKDWKPVQFKDITQFFKDKKIISSGVVAVPHRKGKTLYTQYCAGFICKTRQKDMLEVDIDFYIYWNPEFSLKR
jgi:hypothetical protein